MINGEHHCIYFKIFMAQSLNNHLIAQINNWKYFNLFWKISHTVLCQPPRVLGDWNIIIKLLIGKLHEIHVQLHEINI